MKSGSRTTSRKQQHVNLVLNKNVRFRSKTAGFEHWDFIHNALPELDMKEIDPTTTFLGKAISFPLLISSMTGGYKDAVRINNSLAELCEEFRIPMGVGSQRQAMENSRFHGSFSIARKKAPSIPLFGNIGAAEVARLKDASEIQRMAELIQADGFAIHLNPLQELLQPEGDTCFSGVLRGIEMLAKSLNIPLIVKEVGAGISGNVAQRLWDVGVSIIDVAGAGGTSWAGVEILRRRENLTAAIPSLYDPFWDWGIRTVDCLRQVCNSKSRSADRQVIASGGLSNGLDMAKALVFGADMCGIARPLLRFLKTGGIEGVRRQIQILKQQLIGVMFLTGSRTIGELQEQQLQRVA